MMMQGLVMGGAAEKRIKYGYLYNWYAVDTTKLAPKGWHVPTLAEMDTLIAYVSSLYPSVPAKSLASKTNWTTSAINGAVGCIPSNNNITGFNWLPSGIRYGNVNPVVDGLSQAMGDYSTMWTSTVYNSVNAYLKHIAYYSDIVGQGAGRKAYGCVVRCIRDSGNIETTFTDSDGNLYTSVTIGTQTWSVQNLATTKYNDNTAIPLVTDNTAWSALTTDAYCAYDNNESNVFV